MICDSGFAVQFTSEAAKVVDKTGAEVCAFTRSNGLYIAEVQVENPLYAMREGFHRQGS